MPVFHEFLVRPNITCNNRQSMPQSFQSSDIFIYLGRYDSWLIVLEAMSFGLPVVSTNAYAMNEVIEDGCTGILVGQGEAPGSSAQRGQGARESNPMITEAAFGALMKLLEDVALRRRLGNAARAEVEYGVHSIQYRNSLLKEVFDRALNL